MRLIDVNTLEFHEFYGLQLEDVSYAIFSHTWHDEEVSYHEMKNERQQAQSKEGYTKIMFAVEQAKKDELEWVWVDTCCIDKTSSAELTEAINSMYRWYERSAVCYAYLQDVDSEPRVEEDDTQFKRSRWLTRGWTLQELIAPEQVIFYSKNWEQIGEKLAVVSSGRTTKQIWGPRGMRALCEASGIPFDLLSGERSKDSYSVAQRMSWASRRVSTRIEDTAYCLLGLFDINMPLLYGEEERAFTRLQEEIIRTIDDHSIYAWTIPKDLYWHHTTRTSTAIQHNNISWSLHPILASSPRLFEGSGDVICTDTERHEPSGLTKHGVRIQLHLQSHRFRVHNHALDQPNCDVFRAVLNCRRLESESEHIVLLLMAPSAIKSDAGVCHFYRIATREHCEVVDSMWSDDKSVINKLIYIKQRLPESDIIATRSKFLFQFSGIPVNISNRKSQLQHGFEYYFRRHRGYQVTAADPQTVRDWSHTLNCVGSSPAPGAFDRPRAFVITGDIDESILLVCQVATLGITRSSTTARDIIPRLPSPVLVASVTQLARGEDYELAARDACEGALRNPGPNSHTYTEFPCYLPELQTITGIIIKIGVSIRETKPPPLESWNGGKRVSFTFTFLETFPETIREKP